MEVQIKGYKMSAFPLTHKNKDLLTQSQDNVFKGITWNKFIHWLTQNIVYLLASLFQQFIWNKIILLFKFTTTSLEYIICMLLEKQINK